MYENMGSGVCSDGKYRLAYCQIDYIGKIACRERCDADENCSGYNGATHGSWCHNFYYPDVLSTYKDWNSCHYTDNVAPITSHDSTEDGTCWRKVTSNRSRFHHPKTIFSETVFQKIDTVQTFWS